jgi:hypothetical protein
MKGMLEGLGITNRNKFYYQLTKKCIHNQDADAPETPPNNSELEYHNEGANASVKKNGRPKGATSKAKEKQKENEEKAHSWAAKQCHFLSLDPTNVDENGKFRHSVLKKLAQEAREKFNVDERDDIKADTIHM